MLQSTFYLTVSYDVNCKTTHLHIYQVVRALVLVVHVCLRKYWLQWLCRLVATSCQFVGRCSTASTLSSFTSAFRSGSASPRLVSNRSTPQRVSHRCVSQDLQACPAECFPRAFKKNVSRGSSKSVLKRVPQPIAPQKCPTKVSFLRFLFFSLFRKAELRVRPTGKDFWSLPCIKVLRLQCGKRMAPTPQFFVFAHALYQMC